MLAHVGVADRRSPVACAQIELPAGNLSDRIIVAADGGSHWIEGVYDVYLLRGNCYVNQGLTYARSREAVVWIERGGDGGEPPHKVIAYLEGDVEINYQQADAHGKAAGAATLKDKTWFGRFFSVLPVDVRPMKLGAAAGRPSPTVYAHAAASSRSIADRARRSRRNSPSRSRRRRRVVGPPLGQYRIRVQRRSAVSPEAEVFSNPGHQRVDRAAARRA